MPGRTPSEAYQAFIEPIEAALACIDHAKITVSPGGRGDAQKAEHAWTINGGTGCAFAGGLHFQASMKYRFVPWEGGWRVTTLGYMYSLRAAGDELWSMHWHPVGNSTEKGPHLHIAGLAGGDHLQGPRMTFEQAIQWAITCGVTPRRSDWNAILSHSHDVHIQYRTWS